MSTRFEAELPLKMIHAHPKNPRHSAVADEEMVASIVEHGLLQAVVVAPHATKAGEYVLIAGHRRRDGSVKAKLKNIPAMIRDDLVTEGQQIEAMIVENGHRQDLSPIEEAEGYEQLQLLGYKQAAIAAAVGRNVKTIRTRLGLLALSKTTKAKVHEGQLTLEDAVAIGEFADDAETTKKLEKAAASGQLRYELTNAKQRRTRLQEMASRVAALAEVGATPYTVPDGTQLWELTNKGTVGRVHNTDPDAWSIHDGCLAYLETGGSWPQVEVLCTNPASHAGDEVAEDTSKAAAEEAERAANRAKYEAEKAAEKVAAEVRAGTVLDLVGTGTKLAPQLRDLLRGLLPHLVTCSEFDQDPYFAALNIPEADRWENYWWGNNGDANRTLALQHLAELNTCSDGVLVRALIGSLLGFAETSVSTFDGGRADTLETHLVSGYYSLLSEAGYVNSPPDEKIQEALRAAWAAQADEDEPEAAAS